MLTVADQVLPALEADNIADERTVARPAIAPRLLRPESETDLILDVLMRCAGTFETDRARFVRQVHAGGWQVHSMQGGSLITHRADYAEIAMAWAVGLSRFPMRVTRPRITRPDGGNVRPIAVTSYFGIPILCADHFVGVIELAGTIRSELERMLDSLRPMLQEFGNRLTHDPSLRMTQLIDLECECWIDGGCWAAANVELTSEEWLLLSQMGEPRSLNAIAELVPFASNELIDVVRSLVSRGLVSVRASTRALADTPGMTHPRH